MEVWYIVLLLVFSLALIIIEILFIPGTTLFGIAGILFAIIGIVIGFRSLGSTGGLIVLGSFAVIGGMAVYLSFKSKVWRNFALQQTNNSRVNEEQPVLLHVGDVGKAISALRPSGKAEFGNRQVEVHTLGTFANAGSLVKVIRLDSGKVFVEQT